MKRLKIVWPLISANTDYQSILRISSPLLSLLLILSISRTHRSEYRLKQVYLQPKLSILVYVNIVWLALDIILKEFFKFMTVDFE